MNKKTLLVSVLIWIPVNTFHFTLNINSSESSDNHGILNPAILLTEINYSFSNNFYVVNYIEFYNSSPEKRPMDIVNLRFRQDDIEVIDFEPDGYILQNGFYLVAFNHDLMIAPDCMAPSIIFSFSLYIEFSYTNNNDITNYYTIILSTSANDTNSILVEKSSDQSLIRISSNDGFQNTYPTNDLIHSNPSPTNSALSIANYILSQDIPGQAEYMYPEAKSMILSLKEDQYIFFLNSDNQILVEARKRYTNWAIGLGDLNPYGTATQMESFSVETLQLLIPILLFLAFFSLYLTFRSKYYKSIC